MFECSESITVLTTTETMSNSDTEVTSAVQEEPKSTFITVLPAPATETISNCDIELSFAVDEETKSTFITVLPAPATETISSCDIELSFAVDVETKSVDTVEEEEEEEAVYDDDDTGSEDEDSVTPPSSETSSGSCEEELEFLPPLEDQESESVVETSCCCPGLRGMCTSIKKQIGRLFGRASRIFRRRVSSAPESAPTRHENVSTRDGAYMICSQEDGAESVLSERHQMAIGLLADYIQITYFSVANAFPKSPPVYLLLELFTEQHILGFIRELLNQLLDHPIYSDVTVDPQEVYSHLIHMGGPLENLRSHAENHSQDFVRILAEAIAKTACTIPENALLFWGCPEWLMALQETPPSFDRGAVVEPTPTRRLRCPFRLPKIKLRWLRRCRM
ncbi:uncharacterized protein [Hoplias malabaricus]|uniref:uncharacterized protein isoform X2 n=1 Tax=Hoplias malabaricus TaxID=27720 RepID=UPI003461AFBB